LNWNLNLKRAVRGFEFDISIIQTMGEGAAFYPEKKRVYLTRVTKREGLGGRDSKGERRERVAWNQQKKPEKKRGRYF